MYTFSGGLYTKDTREQRANSYFSCSDDERAAFEAGIKLGTIYHQFVGVPLSVSNVRTLENAIEAGSRVQPFVEEVKVRIDRSKLRQKRGEYDYIALTGDMLDVTLTVKYRASRVMARMRLIKEIDYPLMYIEKIDHD